MSRRQSIQECFEPEQQKHQEMECSPAMLNDVVLTRLFDFLGVKDLKNSRLVCRKWVIVAEGKFRRRTRISFRCFIYFKNDFCEERDIFSKKLAPRSISDYFDASSKDIALSALGLKGLVPWILPVLTDFFKSQGSSVNDLKLERVILRDGVRKNVVCCNCMQLLGEKTFNNLRNLHIDNGFGVHGTKFIIPLLPLKNIEKLYLQYCTILLDGGMISPKELTLSVHITFLRGSHNTEVADSVTINEFVNFSNMNKLNLMDSDKMCIDMSSEEKMVLESVSLRDIKIANWEYANWTIGKLNLDQIKLKLRNHKMNVNEICICWGSEVEIVRFLPPSTKRLEIENCDDRTGYGILGTDLSPQFPNLQCLTIATGHLPMLAIFYNCSQLTDLELTKYVHCKQVDARLIPRNIQRLIIHQGLRLLEFESRNFEVSVRP